MIGLIKRPEPVLPDSYSPASITELNNHAKALSYHLISRLPTFLEYLLPPTCPNLFPESHWVWNSLRKQMKAIVIIMIVNKQMCEKDELKYKTAKEFILSHCINFTPADSTNAETRQNNLDGSYLGFDKVREEFIRAGAAETGTRKRWKEHVSASMLTTESNFKSVLYSLYLNENCATENLPTTIQQKGVFQQLEQLIGIGFDRTKMKEIVSLFEWGDEEIYELQKLKGINARDTMDDKNIVTSAI